jgi:hypothetical protein
VWILFAGIAVAAAVAGAAAVHAAEARDA